MKTLARLGCIALASSLALGFAQERTKPKKPAS